MKRLFDDFDYEPEHGDSNVGTVVTLLMIIGIAYLIFRTFFG